MRTASYAAGRVILFCFGWAFAAVMAYIAEHMMAGAKWPVFGGFAAWWTYICALFVTAEERRLMPEASQGE